MLLTQAKPSLPGSNDNLPDAGRHPANTGNRTGDRHSGGTGEKTVPKPGFSFTGGTAWTALRIPGTSARLLRQCLHFDPPDRTVLVRPVISGAPPTPFPERGCGAPPGANGTPCQRHVGCHQAPLPLSGNHGSFPAGTACGCHAPHLHTSAWRFFCVSFRFVSDFRARQHIDSIDQFFPD